MRKKHLLFNLAMFFTVYTLQAQSTLEGKVYEQNSGWKPVEGIYVAENNSNGDYSKNDGSFSLRFENKKVGETVYPYIGTKKNNIALDIKGKEWELVNLQEVSFAVIPKESSESNLLKLIIAPKGQRDLAALKYYNIIKNHTLEVVQKQRNEIQKLRRELGETNNLVLQKQMEINQYLKINDSISLYNKSLQLASINKDDVDSRILDYLNALENGIAIEDAINLLSSKKAFTEAQKGVKSFENSILEINTIALNNKLEFEFDKAFAQYDSIAILLDNQMVNPLLGATNFVSAGSMAYEINDYDRAIEYYRKALHAIFKTESTESSKVKISIYLELGKLYTIKNEYEMAKTMLNDGVGITTKKLIENQDNLAGQLKIQYGHVLLREGQLYDAEKFLTEGIKLLEKHYHDQSILKEALFGFDRLSYVYFRKQDKKQAELILRRSLDLIETKNNNHIGFFGESLSNIYTSLGAILFEKENFNESNSYFLKAQEIDEILALQNPFLHNMRLAKTYGFLLATQMGFLMMEESEVGRMEIRDKGETLAKKMTSLLDIYDPQNNNVNQLRKEAKDFLCYFKPQPSCQKLKNEDLFSDIFVIDREYDEMLSKVASIDDFRQQLVLHQNFLEKCKMLSEKYPDESLPKQYMHFNYGHVATAALKAGEYNLAIQMANKFNDMDKTGNSVGFTHLVLANAYVLKGEPNKAWDIYRKYKNEPFPNSTLMYRDNFLQDINDLEKDGIFHPEFKKIKLFLSNN